MSRLHGGTGRASRLGPPGDSAAGRHRALPADPHRPVSLATCTGSTWNRSPAQRQVGSWEAAGLRGLVSSFEMTSGAYVSWDEPSK